MKTNIYALREMNFVRYVGKTKLTLEKRLAGHMQEARNGGRNYRCNWIRSLMSKGMLPRITLLSVAEGDGSAEEIAWIKYFRDHGVKLVNGTEGGEGAVFTPEVRKKISRIVTDTWAKDPVRRVRLSEKMRGRLMSPETRLKLSVARTGSRASEETRAKMRTRRHTEAWCKAHSQKLKGRPWTIEQREAHKGHRHSPETLLKMSATRKRYWDSRRLKTA